MHTVNHNGSYVTVMELLKDTLFEGLKLDQESEDADELSGLSFDEVTASNLVKVDLAGNILDDTPFKINPAGFTIHSAIHEVRDDAHCVIHLHTKETIAVATQDRPPAGFADTAGRSGPSRGHLPGGPPNLVRPVWPVWPVPDSP